MMDEITSLLSSMLAGIDTENKTAYQMVEHNPTMANANAALLRGDPMAYQQCLLHPISRVIDGMLHNTLPGNYLAQFLFKHPRYVADHFERVITLYEGRSSCADKSKAIVRALGLHYVDGKEIAWDYDQEYTFHLPKHVFKTEQEVLTFYEAIVNLYSGDPSPYLQALKLIISEQKFRQEMELSRN